MPNRKGPEVPNYLRKLLSYPPQGEAAEGYLARVKHDDWCDHWSGGTCNCNPDIVIEHMHEPTVTDEECAGDK